MNSAPSRRRAMENPKAVSTFLELVKKSAKKKDIYEGASLHARILDKGSLEKSSYLFTALITTYAKMGMLGKAHEVHDVLQIRDVGTWNALIGGYSQQGRGHEALDCSLIMHIEGLSPDVITFICLFKACGSIGNVDRGKLIHEEVVRKGLLGKHIALGNALVDMYAKCGMLAKALQVVNQLPSRTTVSWNILISGYAQQGQAYEALGCLKGMERDGLSPNEITFVAVLQVCGRIGAIDKGTEIHEEIVRRRLIENNIVLGNALVDMYAKCGVLTKAQQVLDSLPTRNAVSWCSLIAGYSELGKGHEALECFERMLNEGQHGDEITFVCLLKACASSRSIEKGEQIHDEIIARGLLTKNIMIGNALVDMYAKCGKMAKAQDLHGKLHVKDVVSWNSLISGYAEHGQGQEAIRSFEQMQREGISPDVITFVCTLKACASVGDIEKGEQIHEVIVRRGLLENSTVLGTALVDMYVKCGVLAKARYVLDRLSTRNEVCWSAIISGYVQQGLCHEGILCFKRMQKEGFSPNSVTFIFILKACGTIGAIDNGKLVHDAIIHSGLLDKDIALGTALVDMHARCGMLVKALEVLEMIPVRNTVSWSALIGGYAQHGLVQKAFSCFEWMQCEGFPPNDVGCLCLLNAFSQSGMVQEAQIIFDNMRKCYGITPNVEHHTCMMVAFGYAGHFDQAIALIETMPCSDHVVLWLALLGACRKWGNEGLSRLAFDRILRLDSKCSAAYSLLSGIYADNGMRADAEKVEAMRLKHAACTKGGYSNVYGDQFSWL